MVALAFLARLLWERVSPQDAVVARSLELPAGGGHKPSVGSDDAPLHRCTQNCIDFRTVWSNIHLPSAGARVDESGARRGRFSAVTLGRAGILSTA